MRKRFGWIVAASLVFLANLPAIAADTYSFGLIPSSGDVAGPAGSTVGWGYSLDNESTSDWLVTSDLQAGTFLEGTPSSLFDFPDLGPGQSVIVPFDPVAGTGLFELIWDGSAAIGFTNAGTFELDAEWWTGNPTNGGTYLTDALPADVAYSAAVTGTSAVPEPSSLALCLVVLGGLVGLIRERKQTR
jgi:hypothetical protein